MATVITSECINCGACEPECPNTAIYQAGVEWELDGAMHPAISNDFFYIVPEKCTECVGFFDHEACAAVCPVDCCVPDPNIPETEAVLLERAKQLHPEATFGDDFPSRFRKSEAPAAADAAPVTAEGGVMPAAPVAEAYGASSMESGLASALPSIEDWEIPNVCRECEGEYAVAYEFLKPGVVFYCPHCQASFVPLRSTYLEITSALERFYQRWEQAFAELQEQRRRELEAFEERQRKELADFEERLREFTRSGQKATGTARRRWF